MGRPIHSILNYIILVQTTLESCTSRPQFAGSLHYINKNSGFTPQKHAMGGSATQQAPNTIIVTHLESLYWCGDFGTKPLQLVSYCSEVRGALFYGLLDLLHALFQCFFVRISCLP